MNTPSTFIALDEIRIATPCRADWNLMDGDDRARFCQSCHKNVYNLAGMRREEAEALIREKNGDVCVRLYRRADGTVITDDCPVGVRIVRRPLKWLMAGFAALLASGAAIFSGHAGASTPVDGSDVPSVSLTSRLRAIEPVRTLMTWLDPVPANTPPIAGGICPPPKPAPTPTPTPKPKEEAK